MIAKLEKFGIIPVVKINDINDALPIAKALIDGGLPVAEITYRTEAASQAIREISTHYPEILIGAGTVISFRQVDEAIRSGAGFIVSPGIDPALVRYCQDKDITLIPGVLTPSEIMTALECGLDTVKFFPAEQAGGLPMIKALSSPFNTIRFIPTGGINEDNLIEYLSFKAVAACGGSFMVSEDMIDSKDWTGITRAARHAVELVGKVRK